MTNHDDEPIFGNGWNSEDPEPIAPTPADDPDIEPDEEEPDEEVLDEEALKAAKVRSRLIRERIADEAARPGSLVLGVLRTDPPGPPGTIGEPCPAWAGVASPCAPVAESPEPGVELGLGPLGRRGATTMRLVPQAARDLGRQLLVAADAADETLKHAMAEEKKVRDRDFARRLRKPEEAPPAYDSYSRAVDAINRAPVRLYSWRDVEVVCRVVDEATGDVWIDHQALAESLDPGRPVIGYDLHLELTRRVPRLHGSVVIAQPSFVRPVYAYMLIGYSGRCDAWACRKWFVRSVLPELLGRAGRPFEDPLGLAD